jgi:hypothetical protein
VPKTNNAIIANYALGGSTTTLEQLVDIAKELSVTPEDFSDVIQEGNMGLFMKLSELCGTQEKVDVEQVLEAAIFMAMKDYVQELGGEENVENTMVGKATLVNEARKGDEDAIENLTLEDMDAYSMLQRRVEKEDILSIVETNFMPYGIECDQYTIVGTIMDVQKLKNDMSEEEVWKMELSVCNMSIDVCINAESLIGEPAVGRRFRGQIWLQGTVQV